jgi:hypothetical protein
MYKNIQQVHKAVPRSLSRLNGCAPPRPQYLGTSQWSRGAAHASEIKQIYLAILTMIAVGSSSSHAQDDAAAQKVKAAMTLLQSEAVKLGPVKSEGTDAVAGHEPIRDTASNVVRIYYVGLKK